eukprot:TRINITY_DN76665_c0_g1_i1.p1 TRINITY_DN76665_c0_g1~~TRINITY_DN76665_c0_g1_i1.p1  ORF type:complete len:705 (-),score=109.87 TRINITY_DN76665_c0_g1_i1:60-2174(-)
MWGPDGMNIPQATGAGFDYAADAAVAASQGGGDMEEQSRLFLERYPMDSRALEYLQQCPADILQRVIETFDPRNKAETDYSRQVTAYIKRLRAEAPSRKRGLEEEGHFAEVGDKRQRLDELPNEDELIVFRLRYPMDDRAFEYLSTAPAAAQAQVLSEFRPRVEGEEDYSSLVTTLVKRARMTAMNSPAQSPSVPALAAHDRSMEPPTEEELTVFRLRYPMDDRAFEYLSTAPAAAQIQVITEFRPRTEGESDYSSLITSFVKRARMNAPAQSVSSVASAALRQADSAAWRQQVHEQLPSQEELTVFRLRYPMDDRAFEYLSTAPAAAQVQVISEFRPRAEGESDYSSLITTLVKRARMNAVSTPAPSFSSAKPSSLGPSLEQLQEFRQRYPMDERAWDFLIGISGHTQQVIISEFRPKREGDTDYSAPVTAFVRAMDARDSRKHDHPPSQCQLDLFRQRFPMDDRAFEYLVNSSADMQKETLQNFLPKNLDETDYSRQLTAFLRRGLQSPPSSGGLFGLSHLSQGNGWSDRSKATIWKDIRDVIVRAMPENGRRNMPLGGQNRMAARLQAFRARYPMDDRAFNFLEQADPAVQETFLSEFSPKREGESDYSAPVTSYIKAVKNRTGGSPAAGGWSGGRASGAGAYNMLETFRRRYPMDDRAFDFLSGSTPEVQREVIERFKPKQEGEADYSGLITTFVRSMRR